MTRMHCTFLAPELSATSSMERGWIIALGHAIHDRPDPPPLLLGQRARLLDDDPVAHAALVALVVGLELLGLRHHALVLRMAEDAVDLHHARLLHGVAHDHSFSRLAVAHRAHVIPSSCVRAARSAPAPDPCAPGSPALGSSPR